MNGYCSRDPEWKQAFVGYVDKEREITGERFPAMALSTVDVDGRPAVRMVTPRGFVGDGFLQISKEDEGQWSSDVLTICTHAKSNKVQELVHTNDVQLVGYLARTGVQIRLSGHASLLFHPDNPNYSTLSLDIRHRVWPRDGTLAEKREIEDQRLATKEAGGPMALVSNGVQLDAEYIREQAYLHHSPVLQAWYSWPPPGKVRLADPALYPLEIPKIKDEAEKERFEANARRNYVLVFIDVNKVDIVDLKQATRRIHTRRGDTSWSIQNVNP
ncbi:hypothetical protein GGI02_002541 [Coemansia sp. RSA 2322]|uniref:Pyridoxamine 5'-phosphate oxidase Alr4036 family FMN-binding domain-containing protein n=1 Tax=Coemansia thaxteri TaxID=2663907 RepID=A0A9W8EHF7_9FUNG|nr:hypothetical protein H4R26_000509 [Coemansia thaxteri]KAJ2471031.1 hypothetical protein GGI02_002541 [Coemansia sp. RSA 2322]KAJ2487285.1 hypothetical protein EV174_000622 [Coemansia sp. RSA 2320]